MKLLAFGPGIAPDVTWTGIGWRVAYGHPDGRLILQSVRPDGEVVADTTVEVAGCAHSFPRLCGNWLVYRRGPEWHAILTNRVEVFDLGPCVGTNPVVISPDYVAYIKPDWSVERVGPAIADRETIRPLVYGSGLSRLVGDQVVTWDEDRDREPGGTCPSYAGDFVVLEDGAELAALCRLHEKELHLWRGQACNTPRCAHDGGGHYAVVTWGDAGVRLALLNEADFDAPGSPPTPPPPPPVPTAKRLPPKIDVRTTYPVTLGPRGMHTVIEWMDTNNPTDRGELSLVYGSLFLTLSNESGFDRTAKERKVLWKP